MLDKLKDLLKKTVKEAVKEAVKETAEEIVQETEKDTAQESAPTVQPVADRAEVVASTQTEQGALVKKLAQCIEANFSGYTVETGVLAKRLSASAHDKAKPVSVLVSKDGAPVLAIAVVRMNTYKSMPVVGTKQIVENLGITYVRFFEERPNEESYVVERLKSYLA